MGGAGATTAAQLITHFNSIWGATKTLRTYAITTLTGDAACLTAQQNQQGGIGAYGAISMRLAQMTGGISQSICAPDYSGLVTQIGLDVHNTTTDAVTLAHTPVAGSVSVTFTPATSIGWTVRGNDLLFAASIPAGTQIDITYDYP